MPIFKILGIFANHTNNIIKYNISLNNYSKLKKNLDSIVIIDSLGESYAEKLQSDLLKDDKIKEYFLIENNNFFDFGKWTYALNNINYDKYDYILLVNDSIIILDELDKFFKNLKNYDSNINFYGYNDSNQENYHYQTYLFFINTTIVNKFINFFESKKKYIHNLSSLIENIELKICELDNSSDCFIKLANEWNNYKNIFWENEDLYQLLLSKNIFSVMKVKKVYHLQDLYKIKIYSSFFDGFDYTFYKTYYEFDNMSDEELFKHFIEIGQYEGRKPQSTIKTILPQCYKDKLDESKLLYFFDIPENFDIYYYKNNNPDLHKLTNLEILNHYINYGIYESRLYNKNSNYNIYLNNFYLLILNKLNNINQTIPEDFDLFYYGIYNQKILNISGYYGYIYHFIKYGSKKKLFYKKSIKDNFNIKEYRENNITLNNLNDDELFDFYLEDEYKKIAYKMDDFNAIIYKKIYEDIKNLSNDEAFYHYINFGKKENRIYKIPYDFDYSFYKSIYDDLKDYDNKSLENHYLFYGVKEGRIYKFPEDFDYGKYKLYNENLSNLSNEELKTYYVKNAIKNKINFILPNDFDHKMYKKIYKDLVNYDDKQLEDHYKFIGIFEKRIYKLPNDFDCVIYKKIYKDLIDYDDDNLKIHYLEYGANEKRIYKLPNDFDHKIYKTIYKDLYKLNKDELEDHYISHGINEKRIYKIPNDFDHEIYKSLYKNLLNYNNQKLENDYLLNGAYEKRIYKFPDDFDYNIYRLKYDDVNLLSNNEIKDHYLKIGFFENRIYKLPNDFNFIEYKSINNDLSNLDEEQINMHYIKYGIDEKRLYKFPSDFNYNIYKNIYKDLEKMNDSDLKKHYIDYGYKEDRIYKLPDDFDCEEFKLMYPFLLNYSDDELKNFYLYTYAQEKKMYKMPKINNETYENIVNKFNEESESFNENIVELSTKINNDTLLI